MKPESKAEGMWRMFGKEHRHYFAKGNPRKDRNERRFTRMKCNRAMRKHSKDLIKEELLNENW